MVFLVKLSSNEVRVLMLFKTKKLWFKLILLCAFLSLFVNILFSVSRFPVILSTLALSFRDLSLLLLALFWPFLIKRKLHYLTFYLYFIYCITIIVFFMQVSFIKNYAPIFNAISISRIVLALPILSIIFCIVCQKNDIKEINKTIEKWFLIFLVICLIESILLIIGHYSNYLSFIGFNTYMSSKGVSSGTAFGFFGSRIITPMFNASVGGMVLGFLVGYFLQNKKYTLTFLTLIPLLFTVSKTGYLIALIFLVFRSNSHIMFLLAGTTYLSLSVFFLDAQALQQLGLPTDILRHMSSVKYHMKGLVTGIDNSIIPVGLGNAGTIVGVDMPELIGRESGFGTGIATSGIFYIISFVVASIIFVKKYKTTGLMICSAYFMVSLMNEASSTFYIWVPIILLFLSHDKNSKIRNHAYVLYSGNTVIMGNHNKLT